MKYIMLRRRPTRAALARVIRFLAALGVLIFPCLSQQTQTVRVIPKEIHDVLVNPGMGGWYALGQIVVVE